MDSIAVLDFGSQYSQLITRRIREAQVYSELFPYFAEPGEVAASSPKGFVLSGGPASVYEPGAPQVPAWVLASGKPILGICYGMQALTHALGGQVAPSSVREYGPAWVEALGQDPLFPESRLQVWMSHGDRIERLPPGFTALARSDHSPIAAMVDAQRRWYGLQFHPEVVHTPRGAEILRAFAVDVCGARPEWRPDSMIQQSVERVREQVGHGRALAAVSGGVDSTVAAALVHRALDDRLQCIFINNGLMRADEPEQVARTFQDLLQAPFLAVDASERFLEALQGIRDPEAKRRRIGETFIRIFEEHAASLGEIDFLVQGTIYPDVVESSAPDRNLAARIKTHHNVGGLPERMELSLVEPLRYLFKDEVRAVGLALGLPEELVMRQPFPGPGLAVRCLGEVHFERLERLRAADRIWLEELESAGLLGSSSGPAGAAPPLAQAFAVLLPVRSVGVMGDQRTYEETIVLRAVTSEDYMTADWARLPADLLARASSRIVNEVAGVNRVVYDITSKPPGTIEWE